MRTEQTKISSLIISVYSFPALVLLLSFIPGVKDLIFSLHGGIGWLLAMACTPFVLIRLGIYIYKTRESAKRYAIKFSIVSVVMYFLIMYPLTTLAEGQMIKKGWPIEKGTFYGFMTMPFSLARPSFWKDKN